MARRRDPSADESQFTAGGRRSYARVGIADRPVADESQFTAGVRRSAAKVRVADVAARQVGRIRYDQLRTLGVGDGTIRRWRRAGYLYRVLPRVYAVGHTARSTESDLAEALLYSGPDAVLSHATAIWWLGLLKFPPPDIHVSSPRRVRSRRNIVVHGERRLEPTWHNGLPVTTPSQAILDFAATGPADLLRLVLANADYDELLDVDELQRMSGRGIAGSAALKHALHIHLPQLAGARSDGEILLLGLCERFDVPIPETNVYEHGFLVDAIWRHQRVVVEVDGWRGHRTPAQLQEDHRRDLELRAIGYVVLRYTERQLIETPAAVAKDLLVHLARELRPQAQDGLRVELGDA
jgi:predicted transcriptional regulator of viral defense system